MKNVVRVWVGDPYNGGHFNGTAFFIDAERLVTAKHVVIDREDKVYENLFISNTPDGGVTPISKVTLCERDIAILEVKKHFSVDKMSFTDRMKVEDRVEIVGFYDKNSSRKHYENNVSGYLSHEHTYELQNHLTHGLSGSPVFLGDSICGVTKAINSSKNITYVIPITELCTDIELVQAKKQEAPSVQTLKGESPKTESIISRFFASLSKFAKYVGFFVISIILLAIWASDDESETTDAQGTTVTASKSTEELLSTAHNYFNQQQLSKALKYYKLALKQSIKKEGKESLEVAQIYGYIAQTAFNKQNVDSALYYSKKAHKIYEKLLDSNDLTMAGIKYQIAYEYNAKGDYSKAYSYLQGVYYIYSQVIPQNDPRFIKLNQDISNLQLVLGAQ